MDEKCHFMDEICKSYGGGEIPAYHVGALHSYIDRNCSTQVPKPESLVKSSVINRSQNPNISLKVASTTSCFSEASNLARVQRFG
jgi:hypothetical protein